MGKGKREEEKRGREVGKGKREEEKRGREVGKGKRKRWGNVSRKQYAATHMPSCLEGNTKT